MNRALRVSKAHEKQRETAGFPGSATAEVVAADHVGEETAQAPPTERRKRAARAVEAPSAEEPTDLTTADQGSKRAPSTNKRKRTDTAADAPPAQESTQLTTEHRIDEQAAPAPPVKKRKLKATAAKAPYAEEATQLAAGDLVGGETAPASSTRKRKRTATAAEAPSAEKSTELTTGGHVDKDHASAPSSKKRKLAAPAPSSKKRKLEAPAPSSKKRKLAAPAPSSKKRKLEAPAQSMKKRKLAAATAETPTAEETTDLTLGDHGDDETAQAPPAKKRKVPATDAEASSAREATRNPRHFFDLPREIRDMIYGFAIPLPEGATLVSTHGWKRDQLNQRAENSLRGEPYTRQKCPESRVSEFLVSKRFYREAAESYISNQTIRNLGSFCDTDDRGGVTGDTSIVLLHVTSATIDFRDLHDLYWGKRIDLGHGRHLRSAIIDVTNTLSCPDHQKLPWIEEFTSNDFRRIVSEFEIRYLARIKTFQFVFKKDQVPSDGIKRLNDNLASLEMWVIAEKARLANVDAAEAEAAEAEAVDPSDAQPENIINELTRMPSSKIEWIELMEEDIGEGFRILCNMLRAYDKEWRKRRSAIDPASDKQR